MLDTKYKNGTLKFMTPEDKDNWDYYKQLVTLHTNESFRKNYYCIENSELRSREWHLDHKFSKRSGFDNNIPPHIIGSVYNLEMILGTDNMSKGKNCSIELEELFEIFFEGERGD